MFQIEYSCSKSDISVNKVWWVRYLLFGEIGTLSSADVIKLFIVNIRSNLQYFAIILQKFAKFAFDVYIKQFLQILNRWLISRVVSASGCHPRDP